MNIWRPLAVEYEPVTELTHWQILYDAATNAYFFSGWTGNEGRHSSKIVEFDLATLTGKTRSGRKYKLVPDYRGWNPDVGYVVSAWRHYNKCDSVVVDPEKVTI